MRNIKLTIAYNGKGYSGFQVQPDRPSVQAELEKALKTLTCEKVKVIGAGRTDAGVHATGQVINFKIASDIELRRLKWSLNAILPKDIVAREAEEVSLDFDARRDAVKRRYEYLILNRDHGDIFLAERVHFETRPLNFEAMKAVAKLFVGRHNFVSFTANSGWKAESYFKTISLFDIEKDEAGLIRIAIEADAFLHHMVRFIAGALIQLGLGVINQKAVEDMLEGRAKATFLSPAKGLTLVQVSYD
ncbi:MAG: tRNA pseudouridine(38-40) synthase TruA [Actinomycetota bacterium]|nr:tRNA pseudouridine(38-40) synthase TruA [Actinomycetota bacterium]